MNMRIPPVEAALLGLTLVAGLAFNACGGDDSTSESTEAPATTEADGDATTTEPTADDPLAALYEECLAEAGQVNLIALPDEWANYKGILAALGEKYPDVKYPVANPDASSKEEMEAVETLVGQADMPDNVDVSPAIAQEMVDKGLFEPYVLTTDAEIPAGLKGADNNWTAAYYGIMAIATSTKIVSTALRIATGFERADLGTVTLGGSTRCGKSFSSPVSVIVTRISCRADSDSVSPWLARWRSNPRYCSSTSRSRLWTRESDRIYATRSNGSNAKPA